MPRYLRSDGAETLGVPADEFEVPLFAAATAEVATFSFLPAAEAFPPKVVAGNYLSHQIAVKTTDMAEINGKLESQCVAIGFHGFLTIIIHLPPFGDDVGIRNSEIFEIGWG